MNIECVGTQVTVVLPKNAPTKAYRLQRSLKSRFSFGVEVKNPRAYEEGQDFVIEISGVQGERQWATLRDWLVGWDEGYKEGSKR